MSQEQDKTVAKHRSQAGRVVETSVYAHGQIAESNPTRVTLLLGVQGYQQVGAYQPWVAEEILIGTNRNARTPETQLDILRWFVGEALQVAIKTNRPILIEIPPFFGLDPVLTAKLVWNTFWHWVETGPQVADPLGAPYRIEFTSGSNAFIEHLRTFQKASAIPISKLNMKSTKDLLDRFFDVNELTWSSPWRTYTVLALERTAIAKAASLLEHSALLDLHIILKQWIFQIRTKHWNSSSDPVALLYRWLHHRLNCERSLRPR